MAKARSWLSFTRIADTNPLELDWRFDSAASREKQLRRGGLNLNFYEVIGRPPMSIAVGLRQY